MRAGHVQGRWAVWFGCKVMDCTYINSSVLQTILQGTASSYPHFADAETEAQSLTPSHTPRFYGH